MRSLTVGMPSGRVLPSPSGSPPAGSPAPGSCPSAGPPTARPDNPLPELRTARCFACPRPPPRHWPGLPPGRRQRCRRVHLVHQAVPTPSFDAVLQRRHHALRPHRGFHPRPVAGFCTLFSRRRHCRCCLLPGSVLHASTFLPPFPRDGFASRPSRGSRRCSTMRALTPASLARPTGLSA